MRLDLSQGDLLFIVSAMQQVEIQAQAAVERNASFAAINTRNRVRRILAELESKMQNEQPPSADEGKPTP